MSYDRPPSYGRFLREGYEGGHSGHLYALALKLCRQAIELTVRGLPPVLLFLDELPWKAFFSIHEEVGLLLSDPTYATLPDFWAWHVSPGQAGWSPHRDKGFRSIKDGRPQSVTVWIPLSHATPENSCMYVLPADRDPFYGIERHDVADEQPLSRELLPHVRALPVSPGDWLAWSQDLLHWGSATSRHSGHHRFSIAMEFQRADHPPMNMPLLGHCQIPDKNTRRSLVEGQVKQYEHMHKDTERLMRAVESYASPVRVES